MSKCYKLVLAAIFVLLYTVPFAQPGDDPNRSTRPIVTGESPNLSARRDMSNRNLALGAPRFVEPGLYNAFDHNGVAIGLIEREEPGINLGMRNLSSSQENETGTLNLSSNNFIFPFLGFTIEDILSTRMYFRSVSDEVDHTESADMSLYMGGIDLGFGAPSKLFQMGLSLHAIYAQAEDYNGNKKIMGQIPKLDLSMGSEVHPLARIGGHFGLGMSFDSTRSSDTASQTWERMFDGEFPNYGFYFDIGDTSMFPLLSNVSLNLYTVRQIGTWKQDTVKFINGREWQYNPVWHNGHNFKMKSTYNLKDKGMSYWPSILLEKWGRSSQRYHFFPGNNQDPFGETGICIDGERCFQADSSHQQWYDAEGLNHKWFFSGINFGMGGFIEIFNYVSTFAEWEIHSVNFEVANDRSLDESDVFNRILIGAEGKLHNIPQWTIPEYLQLFLRGSFSTGADNGTIENYRPYAFQFFDRFTTNLGSRNYTSESYYTPTYGDKVDWFNFNFGFGIIVYNKLQADLYTSLYSLEELKKPFTGFELGAALQVNL